MHPPSSSQTVRMPWSDAPAITVVLVALVVVPLAQMLGNGAGAQHGLEPLLELVAVLLGLLVVSVSLHALEAQEQARANVLVVGFGVAAACNFLHGVLVHSGPVHMPPGSADMSLWLSSWARVAEALTLGLTATRLSAPGPARAWLAAAGGVTLVLAGSALGPLPQWFAHAADGALRQVVAVGLDLEVVAEGVETTGQLSFLRLHGCEGFQGYLFGRPGPVELFEREHLPGHSAPSLATSQPAQQEQRP